MLLRRKRARVAFVLLLVLLTSARGQKYDGCAERATCGDCMGNAACVWCLDGAEAVSALPKCFRRDSNCKYMCNRQVVFDLLFA